VCLHIALVKLVDLLRTVQISIRLTIRYRQHAETWLPYRHPERWWTETAADSGLVQFWPEHYRHGIKQWRERLRACLRAKSGHFEHIMWIHS